MLTEEMEPCSWFRAFNFFSYNNAPQFGERREILNDHTLFLETRINVSGVTSDIESKNTWGRGHSDYLCSAKNFLDSLFGNLNAFSRFKSRKGTEKAEVGEKKAIEEALNLKNHYFYQKKLLINLNMKLSKFNIFKKKLLHFKKCRLD